jgi:hypothetical protein
LHFPNRDGIVLVDLASSAYLTLRPESL